MHFTLLIAGALIPGDFATDLTASLDTPSLKARLAHATLINEETAVQFGNAHLDWLARNLFTQTMPVSTAPYAYAQLVSECPRTSIWHADPVHIEIARDHLLVQSLGPAPATSGDESQLLETANQLSAGLGCRFVRAGDHWFMQTEHDWAIDALPLPAVLEAPMQLPSGKDAGIWNRLHNEIQMAWHAHPVNQTRETERRRTINGIWLHGGGQWKPLPGIKYTQVQSDAPQWQGAAQAAGAQGVSLEAAPVNDALLIVDSISHNADDWSAWLRSMTKIDQRVAAHPADAIDFVLCGNTVRTFASRRSDRFKVWRRRTVAQALTE